MSAWRGLAAFVVPAAIIVTAHVLSAQVAALPSATAALAQYTPVIILALGALLAMGFQRGRIFFALVTLAVAWVSYGSYLSAAPALGLAGFTARTVFAALCIFVPVNLAALALTRDRGIFNLHGLLRAGIIALECGATAWLIAAGNRETVDWLYAPLTDLLTALPAASRIPQMGLLLMAAGVATGIALWWRSRLAIDLAFAAAIVAWALAAHNITQPEQHMLFTAAAALILAIAVLQDAYRMAFRDELTGVPGRRAMNDHFARLGRQFVIAVVDIDHFKKFNDTHGHDVGDQVLKMVAKRIERVGGGGSAYRFGGEEFVIVFPGAAAGRVIPHLDALRIDVAQHGLVLRAADRAPQSPSGKRAIPREPRKPRAARSSHTGAKKLSVHISIGVAERNDKLQTPAAVMTAADKALYRAKRGGRNQVSR